MNDISLMILLDDIAQNAIKFFEAKTGLEFGFGNNCRAKEMIEFYSGKIEYDFYTPENLVYKGLNKRIVYVLNPNLINKKSPEKIVLLTLFSHVLLLDSKEEFELGEIIYPDKKLFVDADKYKKELMKKYTFI